MYTVSERAPWGAVNYQNLFRLIRANEEAIGFDLSRWINNCGTYGCLVGNDYLGLKSHGGVLQTNLRYCLGPSSLLRYFVGVTTEYGLSPSECTFLFGHANYGFGYCKEACRSYYYNKGMRDANDRNAAINRVRKFLYYKLHKAEMMADEKYRRLEGDHGVVMEASRKAVAV